MTYLHYIRDGEVFAVEATRDRLMTTSLMFFKTRREALTALKEQIAEKVNFNVKRLMELEREIAHTDEQTSCR